MSTRRRIASLVLLVGVILVGAQLLRAHDRVVDVDVIYRVGDAPWAHTLEVDLAPVGGGAAAAHALRTVDGPELRVRTHVAPGDYAAAITLTGEGGQVAAVTRTLHIERDATVTVDLATERPR